MAKKSRNKEKQDLDMKSAQLKGSKKEALERRIQMSFEVSADFKRAYKLYAIEHEKSLLEIFKESFELYKKVFSTKSKGR